MQILALSDSHGQFPSLDTLPDADVLIHCGDWTNWGLEQGDQEFDRVSQWVMRAVQRYPHILSIPGNHDIGLRNHHFDKLGAVGLDGKTWVHPNGTSFHGVALTPAYDIPSFVTIWDHMTLNPQAEAAAWDFEPVDVVIAHGPPKGYLDRVGSRHPGSSEALRYIKTHQPKLYLCGHIHEGVGEVLVGKTRVVNVAEQVRLIELDLS